MEVVVFGLPLGFEGGQGPTIIHEVRGDVGEVVTQSLNRLLLKFRQ